MKKLSNKTILLTGSTESNESIKNLLKKQDANIIAFPMIEIVELPNGMDTILSNLNSADWIIFTSRNAAQFFIDKSKRSKINLQHLNHLKIAAIGSSTAKYLESNSLKINFLPNKFNSNAFAEEFCSTFDVKGKTVLIPRSLIGNTVIQEELLKRKATLFDIPVYDTIIPSETIRTKSEILELFQNNKIDWILFFSSSAVNNFMELFNRDSLTTILKNSKVACIGPETGKSVELHGFTSKVTSNEHTLEGLVNEIIDFEELN